MLMEKLLKRSVGNWNNIKLRLKIFKELYGLEATVYCRTDISIHVCIFWTENVSLQIPLKFKYTELYKYYKCMSKHWFNQIWHIDYTENITSWSLDLYVHIYTSHVLALSIHSNRVSDKPTLLTASKIYHSSAHRMHVGFVHVRNYGNVIYHQQIFHT